MKVGLVKERAPNERRVALTPDALKPLLGAGVEILVEKGAGDGAGRGVLHGDDDVGALARHVRLAHVEVRALLDLDLVAGVLHPRYPPLARSRGHEPVGGGCRVAQPRPRLGARDRDDEGHLEPVVTGAVLDHDDTSG